MAKKSSKKVEPASKAERNIAKEEKERLSAESTAHINPYVGDKKIIVKIAGDRKQEHPYTGDEDGN